MGRYDPDFYLPIEITLRGYFVNQKVSTCYLVYPLIYSRVDRRADKGKLKGGQRRAVQRTSGLLRL